MTHPEELATDHRPAVARWLSGILGGWAFASGLLTLVGWGAGVERLIDWEGNGISMKANAALAAAAAGGALIVIAVGGIPRGRILALVRGLALFAALLGGLTLLEHVSGLNLGIDTLIVDEAPGARATAAPGRMGVPASTATLLVGIGLVLITLRPRARAWAPALGLLAASIAVLSLTGILFHADPLFTLPRLTGISLQMSTAVLALGLGLVAAVPERQPVRTLLEDSASGVLARRALPFIIALPLVLGWFRIRGQDAGLFDTGMGAAMLVVALIILQCGILWWGIAAVATHENALVSSLEVQQRAELALRGIRDQFVMLDKEWRFIYVNHRAAAAMGLAQKHVLGRTLWELRPQAAGAELEAVTRRVMARREPESVEFHDGASGRWFQQRLYPSQHGGIAIFTVDVTRHRRTEASLAQSEQRFRTLASVISGIPWIADPQGAFAVPQPDWERFTGQDWPEVQGFGWVQAIHPDDRDRVRNEWGEARASCSVYESGARLWEAASSGYRHMIFRAAPVPGDDGGVREWVGSCTDVNNRLRAAGPLDQREGHPATIGESAPAPYPDVRVRAGVLGAAPTAPTPKA